MLHEDLFQNQEGDRVCLPLIDWISDTLSQGYTNLQSLVKCLDHRNIVSDIDTGERVCLVVIINLIIHFETQGQMLHALNNLKYQLCCQYDIT